MNPTLQNLKEATRIGEKIEQLQAQQSRLLAGLSQSQNGASPIRKRRPMSAKTKRLLSKQKRAYWKRVRAEQKAKK